MAVSIVGIGVSKNDLTSGHIEIIKRSDILIGGERLLDLFPEYTGIKKEIKKNLKFLVQYINENLKSKSIVVLASGDPMFFGIGSFLVKRLGKNNVKIYPNISSIAYAFARIKEPWHDAHVITLHGREFDHRFFYDFANKDKIAVLTDSHNTPFYISKLLFKKGFDDFKICVLEQLGSLEEKITWYDLDKVPELEFTEPNIVILKRENLNSSLKVYPGMEDSCFEHEKGLITKSEVRTLSLSKLNLHSSDLIMWDLGAGSGSVSIEASFYIRAGKIFAVEKNPDRINMIKSNKEKFEVYNLEIVNNVLPDGLDALPCPDRIFIGGGGKNLDKIISIAATRLKANGIIVINTVLITNIDKPLNILNELGFQTDIIQVQINKARKMPWSQRLEAHNPVWIITGRKDNRHIV